jgi:hypothetical protein
MGQNFRVAFGLVLAALVVIMFYSVRNVMYVVGAVVFHKSPLPGMHVLRYQMEGLGLAQVRPSIGRVFLFLQ